MRSPGRGQVAMPDLTTDTVGQAELTVRGVGLSWCPPATAPTSDPAEVGRVIGQSPPVGTVVPTGTQVTVIVGTADQPAAHPASVWHAPVRSVALTSPCRQQPRPGRRALSGSADDPSGRSNRSTA
jgi:beta-lactam-binding protein with PASTA domain